MEVNPQLTIKGQRDQILVQTALKQGNQKAYSELVSLYWDALFYLLLRMTGSREDAEDLTIESFSKAFKNLSQYTPDYAFSTWLFRIASNHGIDFIRRRKKNVLQHEGNELIDDPLHADELAGSGHDPEQDMIRDQQIKHMRQLVDSLRPRYRKLVLMRYFEEQSYEEIAQSQGLPLGTVKAQLFRAREFLSNTLTRERDAL